MKVGRTENILFVDFQPSGDGDWIVATTEAERAAARDAERALETARMNAADIAAERAALNEILFGDSEPPARPHLRLVHSD